MPTLTPTRPSVAGAPSPEQRHHALAAIRGIAARRRAPGPAHFVCIACETAWCGDEAVCWNCGRHAAIPYADSRTAQLLLLHRARISTARRDPS